MTDTPETKFKNKVRKYLKDNNVWFVKFFANMFTPSGIPDILGLFPNGQFFGLELKVEPNKPTALQLRNIELINKSKGYARVLYPKDFDDFKQDIEMIIGEQNG